MATVTTIVDLKTAFLDELQELGISSDTAAAPAEVQVSYARPPVDQVRSECVYFSDELQTIGEAEQRMTSGRRKRFNTWELQIIVLTAIRSNAEAAERSNFAIVQAIEGFLADSPQPSEWPTTPVTSGALYIIITGYEVRHYEDVEGFRAVETTITTEVKERLV